MSAMMSEEVQLVNGEVWASPRGERGLAQWIDDDYWVLLSEPQHTAQGFTAMAALPNRAGGYWFSHAELFYWLVRNGWCKCEARIAMQAAQ